MDRLSGALDRRGRGVLANVEEMGKILLLFLSVLTWMVRRDAFACLNR
ncbi:MAG: hypothetical protein ACYDAA_15685 [Syntrophales bacterium]